MNTKRFLLFATFLFCTFMLFAQINTEKTIQINPYLGLSSPQGDFKNFAENGYVLGLSLDKYLSSKFGLGVDLNYQSNGYKNGTDFSIISNPYGVLSNVSGEWSSTNITFGPTYKFGNGKINAEIYTKAGISMVKSPSEEVTLTGGSYPSFTIFKLDEQKVNALGIMAGLRLSYPISDNIAVFVNPQYVYSSSEINYLYKDLSNPFFSSPDGADPVFEPGLLDETPIQEGVVKPSYFNLNAGIKLSFGGKKTTSKDDKNSANLNPSICRLQFVKAECDVVLPVMTLSSNWSGFNIGFTQAVEVYDGNTLLNPSVIPQVLSQNYGNQLFNIPVSVPIGTNLTAKLKIYDLNGNVVCESVISFLAPQCSPQPPSCNFDLDIENATCDSNTIIYNTTSSWANLNIGSIISLVAKDQSGTPIQVTAIPSFPITINASNTSGSISNSISIPSSYNGTPISILLKITEPTTGYEKLCGFLDSFIPNCQPSTTICNWTYKATCDPINKGIKIDVTSSWSNVPTGSTLNYKLINLNGGASIPFTFSPNNLPQPLVNNGSSTHRLYINSNFSGTQAVLKMEIVDSNGVVLCNNGIDITLPSCVFETCELVEIEATCINEQPNMRFSVDWNNYSNFSNYSIYLDAKDENGNQVAWFNSAFPPFNLTASSGSKVYSMNLMSQYAGTTITINSKICETASNGIKHCCESTIKIKIPKCCEVCSDIIVEDTTNRDEPNGQIFHIKGNINPVSSGSSPIKKIVIQLESISFDNRVTPGTTAPNYEFKRGWFGNNTGSFSPNITGSLLGNRSNLLIVDINATTATNLSFILNIDNYLNKRVMSYSIKLTIFKQDGTYCEKFLTYTR